VLDPRRRFTRLRAVSAIFGVAAMGLVGASGASAAPPWEAPVDLSATGKDAFLAQTGISGSGESFALWDCTSGCAGQTVQSSYRPPGSAWTPLQSLEKVAYVPDLAVTPNGLGYAAWWRGGNGVNHIIKTSFGSGGNWSTAIDVTDEEEGEQEGKKFNGAYFPHIAANEKGDAVVVWQECFSPEDLPVGEPEPAGPACTTEGFEEVGRYVERAAYRPAGGTWSAPQTLSKATETAIKARVAIDAAGNAIVVWEGDELPFKTISPKVIYAGRLKAGQTTWSVQQISPLVAEAGEPHVAFDAAGNATALFHVRETPSSDLLVESTVLNAHDTSWSSSVQVSQSGEATFEPQLAVNAAGAAVAIWRGNKTNRIEGKVRTGGVWSPTQQNLSAEGVFTREPRLGIDSAGDAVAVWRYTNAGKNQIQGSLLPAGGSWSGPVDLSAAGQSAGEPDLELNAKGSAVATWRRFNGSNQIVQASTLSASLSFQAQSIPTKGAAGSPVSFSVSPVALWPGITTKWEFGDGKTAIGNNVSHTYAKGRTYKVTVTSTDGPGNSATATGNVIVAAGTAWVSQRLLKVTGSRARVPMMCNRVATCNGLLKLVSGPKAKRTVLGKASFVVGAGKGRTVNVVLSKKAKGLLAASRRHVLSAAVEGLGVRQRSVVLKAKPKRR
jgi:hypothetical protein